MFIELVSWESPKFADVTVPGLVSLAKNSVGVGSQKILYLRKANPELTISEDE